MLLHRYASFVLGNWRDVLSRQLHDPHPVGPKRPLGAEDAIKKTNSDQLFFHLKLIPS